VVVTHYLGLTVAEMTDLRGRLRNEGAQLQVVKNTLASKALDGSIGEEGDALFKGPVAIAFAPDPVSAAKVATQYAKTMTSSPSLAASWVNRCWTRSR
jgi:large subunit ribosomal protein L10